MVNTKSLLLNSILLGLLSTATINFGMEERFLQLYMPDSSDCTKYHPIEENATISEQSIKINKKHQYMNLGFDAFGDSILKKIDRQYICSLIHQNNNFFIKPKELISDIKAEKISNPYLYPTKIITEEQFSLLLQLQQLQQLQQYQQKQSEENNELARELALLISDKYNIYQINEVKVETNSINSDEEDFVNKIIRDNNNNNDTKTDQENLSTESTNKKNQPTTSSYFTSRNIRFVGGIGILLAIIYFAYKNNLNLSKLLQKFSFSSSTTT